MELNIIQTIATRKLKTVHYIVHKFGNSTICLGYKEEKSKEFIAEVMTDAIYGFKIKLAHHNNKRRTIQY